MNDSLVDQWEGLTITIREPLGGLRTVWAQEEREGTKQEQNRNRNTGKDRRQWSERETGKITGNRGNLFNYAEFYKNIKKT